MKKIYLFIIVLSLTALSFTSQAQTWSAVGSGFNLESRRSVNYNSELYACGKFTTADGSPANYIAKWNGSNWMAVGTGMNNEVTTLAVYNGDLYAGGNFTTAGGNSANYIAKWNGTSWSAVGAGMGGGVLELTVDAANNVLYAGGVFTTAGGAPANRIAKWDGTSWTALGTGLNNKVLAIEIYNNELYAGGNFSLAGSQLAKWNGISWNIVNAIVNATNVQDLLVYNAELYMTGQIGSVGSLNINNIAKWDGTNWSAIGSGLTGSNSFAGGYSLYPYNGALYVGGYFTTAGGNTANNIAKWNGITWSSAGNFTGAGFAVVYGLNVYNGNFYALGNFSGVDGNPISNVATFSTTITGVSESQINNSELTIYPNPSTGIFTIKNDNISSPINFEVYNLLGEIILQKQNSTQVDLSNVLKGIYFVKIAVGTKNYTEKIVVH